MSKADAVARTGAAGVDGASSDRGELTPITAIVAYLQKQAFRRIVAKELAVFLVFLVCLTILLSLQRFSTMYSDGFFAVGSAKGFVKPTEFNGIDHPAEFWTWFSGLTSRLWNVTGVGDSNRDANYPLLFLLLRQFRVNSESCPSTPGYSVLPQQTMAALPQSCYPKYTKDSNAEAAFGPSSQWLPNSRLTVKVNSNAAVGILQTYDNADAAYAMEIPFSLSVNDALTNVDYLRTNNWIDTATRAVAVEFTTVCPSTQTFVFVSLVVEFTESGWVEVYDKYIPFTFENWRLEKGAVKAWVCLVLDVIIALTVLYSLFAALRSIRLNLIIHGFNFFDIVMLVNVVLFGIAYAYRVQYWVRANRGSDIVANNAADINANNGGDSTLWAWDWLSDSAVVYQNLWVFYTVAAAITWTRLFGLLQHSSRLNALSNTLRFATGQLVSMMVIFGISLIGFAYLGHVLYGHYLTPYRTIWRSAGSLVALVLGGRDNYDQMVQVHPDITAPFVILFYLIIWLLLLNLVLGILTGAFAVIQEAMQDPDWSYAAVWRDLSGAIRIAFRGDAADYSARPGEKYVEPIHPDSAVSVLRRVRRYQRTLDPAAPASAFLTQMQFRPLSPELSEDQAQKVFEKSKNEFGGKNVEVQRVKAQLDGVRTEVLDVNALVKTVLEHEQYMKSHLPPILHHQVTQSATLEDFKPKIDLIPEIARKRSAAALPLPPTPGRLPPSPGSGLPFYGNPSRLPVAAGSLPESPARASPTALPPSPHRQSPSGPGADYVLPPAVDSPASPSGSPSFSPLQTPRPATGRVRSSTAPSPALPLRPFSVADTPLFASPPPQAQGRFPAQYPYGPGNARARPELPATFNQSGGTNPLARVALPLTPGGTAALRSPASPGVNRNQHGGEWKQQRMPPPLPLRAVASSPSLPPATTFPMSPSGREYHLPLSGAQMYRTPR